MTGRNELCPCGSGLKFKKCCLNKKARTRSVTIDLGVKRTIDAISFDPKTGQINLYHQGVIVTPVAATAEISYPRAKGPKVLSQAEVPVTMLRANPDGALEEFDRLLAIDTNYRRMGGGTISVTGIILGELVGPPEYASIGVKYAPVHCLEFRGIEKEHERVGWAEAILGFRALPRIEWVA